LERERAVIDACCTINLLASRRAEQLIEVLRWTLLMTEPTRREVLYLEEPPDAHGARGRTEVDTSDLESAGYLRVVPIGAEMIDSYVACAAHLTDSDASTVALAGTASLPLLSDDPKIRRVAREMFPEIELWSTLGLIRTGTGRLCIGQDELAQLARDVRWRGRFLPPNGDPDREWFRALLRPGS
jgi:hypothetical protein